jgi:hypothetical protein
VANENAGAVVRDLRGSLAWFGLAVATAALITFLHELGHYWVGAAFDFPGLTFEPTSVNDAAEAAGVPEWQRGVKSAAGPLVNWSFVAVACLAARRQPVARWALIVGLVASIRGGLEGGAYLIARALGAAPRGQGHDELDAAALLHLPVIPVMVVTLGLAIAAWWFLVTRLAAGRRLWTAVLTVAGTVAGYIIYARAGALMM